MMIDVHFHPDLFENYFEELKKGLKEKQIIAIANGLNYKSNLFVKKFSKEMSNILPALGFYPTEIEKSRPEEIEKTLKMLETEDLVAIGEVGLDKQEGKNFDKQVEIFRKIIEIAKERDKPLIIHSRKAEQEVIEILEETEAKADLHFFSGRKSLIKRALNLPVYFSIPANAFRSSHFRMLIQEVPLEKLLLETDAPFLSPNKEWPNWPWNVEFAIKTIAEVKEINKESVEERIFNNFKAFLGQDVEQ